jgi:hypothetical protein
VKFKRGDTVEWWSHLSGRTRAVFVEYDPDFPSRYVILAIGIGRRGNRLTHTFRWPLRQVERVKAGRMMTT